MSTQAIAPTAGAGAVAPGMLAASERVQHLQALAAELREGPSSFAAALDAAGTGQAGQAATPATGISGQATATAAALGEGAATAASLGQGAAPTALGATSPLQSSYATLPATGASASAQPAGAGQYDQLIEASAARNGVDPAVLHGLIQQESDFDPSSRSSAGAVGLTQLMPSTATSLGVSEPLDPAQSIEGGARYLGEMMRRFGGNVEDALAAYNAGPGAVQQYGGVPPYAETQQYVGKVLGYAAEYRQGAGASAASPIAAGALA